MSLKPFECNTSLSMISPTSSRWKHADTALHSVSSNSLLSEFQQVASDIAHDAVSQWITYERTPNLLFSKLPSLDSPSVSCWDIQDRSMTKQIIPFVNCTCEIFGIFTSSRAHQIQNSKRTIPSLSSKICPSSRYNFSSFDSDAKGLLANRSSCINFECLKTRFCLDFSRLLWDQVLFNEPKCDPHLPRVLPQGLWLKWRIEDLTIC